MTDQPHQPFVRAGFWAIGGALVLVFLGTMLFLRIGGPMVTQLEESKERLNLALKSARIGTWDWDVVKNSHTWDDYIHPLYGLKPGTFSGRVEDFIDMLHPEDRERVAGEVNRSVEEDVEYDTEYRVVWPDGEVFGIICVLDLKENRYSKAYEGLMLPFKELVEAQLGLLYDREHLEDLVEQRTTGLREDNSLLRKVKFLLCKRV